MTQRYRMLAIALGVVVVLLIGYGAGLLTARPSHPGDASPEAGFARDMTEHHNQAVEMGMIAYQKASRADIRSLGADIAMTQKGQVGVMQTWLKDWGLSPNSTRTPMSWMPEGQRALDGNRMPGMATRDEVAKLNSATGVQVDILFCQYMLRHHIGGIHMVDGVLAQTDDPQIRELAQGMKDGQTKEIQVLRSLLEDLGAKPL
ncbi:MAG: DUF305 domain-containing protein [Micromonosporaceae bacterium]